MEMLDGSKEHGVRSMSMSVNKISGLFLRLGSRGCPPPDESKREGKRGRLKSTCRKQGTSASDALRLLFDGNKPSFMMGAE